MSRPLFASVPLLGNRSCGKSLATAFCRSSAATAAETSAGLSSLVRSPPPPPPGPPFAGHHCFRRRSRAHRSQYPSAIQFSSVGGCKALDHSNSPPPATPAAPCSPVVMGPEVKLCPVDALESSDYDGIVVVTHNAKDLPHQKLRQAVEAHLEIDPSAEKACFVARAEAIPSKRVIYSGTGALDKDYDDVRAYFDAAKAGIKKALAAGCIKPLLYVNEAKFEHGELVSILGALDQIYVPLETRESVPDKATGKVQGPLCVVLAKDLKDGAALEKLAAAVEQGKVVCRDIGGSDPERMAAPRVEDYVRECFKGTKVKVEVIKGQENLEKTYPCFAAVNRAASGVARHDGRVIWLTLDPEDGTVEQTLFLVGKGVTYDTGGADIKAGGIMAGMSRDKCGSAVVAGLIKALSHLKPKGLRVVGAMAMVRNSVGSNCYVSDEIITSRAGVRLRVGNTDAEGRMAMVDVLAHAKEKAMAENNPHLFTIATLTGHAALAMGPYTAVMDNGAARREQFAQALFRTGEAVGDPYEVSNIRREDYKMIMDKSQEFVEVIQCNCLPSSRTPRGHQFAPAFMSYVSGLDKLEGGKALKYTHLDVAGSSGDLPGPTTAAGLLSLLMHFTTGQ